jgi:probable phosphoglycerate mutase
MARAGGDPAARAAQAGQADLGRPATLILVRHGRTEDTEQRRVRGGSSAGPELSPAGLGEARRLAEMVGGWPDDAGRPVAVLTSPLLRARQTAGLVAAALDLEPMEDEDWAEVSLGDWDGRSYAEIADGWPAEYRAWRASTAVAPPHGESLDDVAERVGTACDRVIARYPGRTVLVVTHTAPIRTVLRQALDAGPASLWRLRVDPVRLSVLRFWADGGCEVATVNSPARPR